MAITPSELKKFAPEFEDQPNSRLNIFIGMADRMVNESCWGDKADDARLLLSAHFTTLGDRGAGGTAGAVTSEKVGDLQTNYANPSSSSGKGSEFMSTSYGQIYLQLRKTLVVTPMVVDNEI